jgi:hypothetical protein
MTAHAPSLWDKLTHPFHTSGSNPFLSLGNAVGGAEHSLVNAVTHPWLPSLPSWGGGEPSAYDRAKKFADALTGPQEAGTDPALIQQAADLLSGLKAGDAQKLEAQMGTLGQDVSKVWGGQTPQQIVDAQKQALGAGQGFDALTAALGSVYQKSLLPFEQAWQKAEQPVMNSLLADLKGAIGKSGGTYAGAMAGVPESIAAANQLQQQAAQQQMATAPQWEALLAKLSQEGASYRAAQQQGALGLLQPPAKPPGT